MLCWSLLALPHGHFFSKILLLLRFSMGRGLISFLLPIPTNTSTSCFLWACPWGAEYEPLSQGPSRVYVFITSSQTSSGPGIQFFLDVEEGCITQASSSCFLPNQLLLSCVLFRKTPWFLKTESWKKTLVLSLYILQ